METKFRESSRVQAPTFADHGGPDRETQRIVQSSQEVRDKHKAIADAQVSSHSERFNGQNVQDDGQ